MKMTFTTEKALRRYLLEVQCQYDNPIDFYNRLVKIADTGVHVMDVEDSYTYQDLCELV